MIAFDEHNSRQFGDELQTLVVPWPKVDHIPETYPTIDERSSEVDHGFQCGQVRMYVAEDSGSHDDSCFHAKMPCGVDLGWKDGKAAMARKFGRATNPDCGSPVAGATVIVE